MAYQPKSAVVPIFAIAAIVLVMAGSYFAAYFGLSEVAYEYDPAISAKPVGIERTFPQKWIAKCFFPAAWTEYKVRGVPIILYGGEQ